MEQLTQFIIHHWLLCAALVLILILLFLMELQGKAGGNRLSPTEATQLVNRQNATIIDIRDPDIFASGYIGNAINIPQAELTDGQKLKKYRNKPIILVDNNGQNSAVVAHKLKKEGLTDVYILAGGLTAWKSAGIPLSKSK